MAAGAPTLTAKTSPVPGVEVYWSSFPAGTDSISVYRLADGERTLVRNASAVSMSGSFAVVDYEAPLGTLLTYSAETFIAGVSDGISATATITLSSSDVWLQDPLNPNAAIKVSLTGGTDYTLAMDSFNSLTRQTVTNKYNVLGRSKPVTAFFGRKSLEGITLDVLVDNANFDDFNDLMDAQPLLIRTPSALRYLPRSLYCTVSAVEEPVDWYLNEGTDLTRFKLTVDEVEGQTLTIFVNLYTYSQYEAKYATYTAAGAVYGSYDYTYVTRNPLA